MSNLNGYISPDVIEAAMERAHRLRAEAFKDAVNTLVGGAQNMASVAKTERPDRPASSAGAMHGTASSAAA